MQVWEMFCLSRLSIPFVFRSTRVGQLWASLQPFMEGTFTFGKFMFLRSPMDWSFCTVHLTELARHAVTTSTNEPSAIRMVEPG